MEDNEDIGKVESGTEEGEVIEKEVKEQVKEEAELEEKKEEIQHQLVELGQDEKKLENELRMKILSYLQAKTKRSDKYEQRYSKFSNPTEGFKKTMVSFYCNSILFIFFIHELMANFFLNQ